MLFPPWEAYPGVIPTMGGIYRVNLPYYTPQGGIYRVNPSNTPLREAYMEVYTVYTPSGRHMVGIPP